jgi:hypothetical protein
MLPFEREQFRALVELSGVPWEDYLEREKRLLPSYARRAAFRPAVSR